MSDERLKDLFLNWKGLEIISNLKGVCILLSIIFIFISITISNVYLAFISLIILFLQILSDNKEYSLKYKEIFEKVKDGKKFEDFKDWIKFLDKTKGLGPFSKWVFNKFYHKELKGING